ncbi:MAG: hypothetical protein QM718_07820 [Steroidobacteraceae bacterium]
MIALLALWFFVPSLLMVGFSLSSMAAGIIAVACAVVAATVSVGAGQRIGRVYPLLLGVAVLSVVVSVHWVGQPLAAKQLISIAAFVILAIGATTLFHAFFSQGYEEIGVQLKRLYLLLLLIGFVGVVYPLRIGAYAKLNHPVVPFSEPSHFALAYSQVAVMLLPFLRRSRQYLVILASLVLAITFPNTTMLVVAVMLMAVVAPLWLIGSSIAIAIPVVAWLLVAAPEWSSYFSDRISTDNNDNLSRLVYLQGWESLVLANSSTGGLGIGFQNLGNEPEGVASELISKLLNAELNRADGGFMLAKIGGEFGCFGIALSALLLLLATRAGLRLRKCIRLGFSKGDVLELLPLGSLYMFIVELMVRGMGYFSPSFILVLYFLPSVLPAMRICAERNNVVRELG